MIVALSKPADVAGIAHYVLGKKGARLLDTNLAGSRPLDFIDHFRAHTGPGARLSAPYFHASLRPAPGEALDDRQWREVAALFLGKMGFATAPYLAALHTDTPEHHVHIVASRLRLDRSVVSDSWDYYRAMAIAREIERSYGLRVVPHPSPELAPHAEQAQHAVVERLQATVRRAAGSGRSFAHFVSDLERRGVTVRAKLTSQGKVQGLTYELEGLRLPASRLGHNFTWGGLRHRLGVAFDPETDTPTLKRLAAKPKRSRPRGELLAGEPGEQLSAGDREILLTTVITAAQGSGTLTAFSRELRLHGVELVPNLASTGRLTGVSFRWKGQLIKGSALDRKTSWGALQRLYGLRFVPEDLEPLRRSAPAQTSSPDSPMTTVDPNLRIRNVVDESARQARSLHEFATLLEKADVSVSPQFDRGVELMDLELVDRRRATPAGESVLLSELGAEYRLGMLVALHDLSWSHVDEEELRAISHDFLFLPDLAGVTVPVHHPADLAVQQVFRGDIWELEVLVVPPGGEPERHRLRREDVTDFYLNNIERLRDIAARGGSVGVTPLSEKILLGRYRSARVPVSDAPVTLLSSVRNRSGCIAWYQCDPKLSGFERAALLAKLGAAPAHDSPVAGVTYPWSAGALALELAPGAPKLRLQESNEQLAARHLEALGADRFLVRRWPDAALDGEDFVDSVRTRRGVLKHLATQTFSPETDLAILALDRHVLPFVLTPEQLTRSRALGWIPAATLEGPDPTQIYTWYRVPGPEPSPAEAQALASLIAHRLGADPTSDLLPLAGQNFDIGEPPLAALTTTTARLPEALREHLPASRSTTIPTAYTPEPALKLGPSPPIEPSTPPPNTLAAQLEALGSERYLVYIQPPDGTPARYALYPAAELAAAASTGTLAPAYSQVLIRPDSPHYVSVTGVSDLASTRNAGLQPVASVALGESSTVWYRFAQPLTPAEHAVAASSLARLLGGEPGDGFGPLVDFSSIRTPHHLEARLTSAEPDAAPLELVEGVAHDLAPSSAMKARGSPAVAPLCPCCSPARRDGCRPVRAFDHHRARADDVYYGRSHRSPRELEAPPASEA